jgi:UDP-N-acetylmuramoylalanine--D-glutamate ligase
MKSSILTREKSLQPLPANGPLLILGAGISGRGAARLLTQRGYSCRFFDESQQAENCITNVSEIRSGRFSAAVSSPGFGPAHPAIQATHGAAIPIFSEVEIAIVLSETPYIGITGSNGKTTTTALLSHLLQAKGEIAPAVGNIGHCFSDAILDYPEADRFVVELSSYQLERFEPARPAEVALLLNISPDHLERHGTLENYVHAKLNLAQQAKALVYNADDPAFAHLPALFPDLPTLSFGINNPQAQIRWQNGVINTGISLSTSGYRLQGLHNLQNVMAAIGTCRLLGHDPEQINRAVASFSPLAHRLEPLSSIKGVSYINDSKATNEDAVNYALQTFPPGTVHLLAGGIIKSDDLSTLRPLIEKFVIHLYLYGQDRERILAGLGTPENVSLFETMAEALEAAATDARSGETVLLSPMGASFDQFRNFEERGDYFRELVSQLSTEAEENE